MRAILPARLAAVLALLAPAPAVAQGYRQVLGADTANWFGLGGQVRLRWEGWDGYAFRTPADSLDSDGYGLARLLAHAELRLEGVLAFYVEGKSSLVSDRALPGGERAVDKDVIDLQQAWAEVAVRSAAWRLSGRLGRADLAFGRERLVSPLDWANTRRTFQGAQAVAAGHGLTLTGFWARPVQVRQTQPNIGDSTRQLYGVYASKGWASRRLTADLYWLRHEARSAAWNGTSGGERRHTTGARLARRAPVDGGQDFDLEVAGQWGSVGGQDVGAWMAVAQAGHTFPGPGAAHLQLGLDYASGDAAPGGAVGTFAQLYPLGHAWLGFADVHGRQNVVDLSFGASVRPTAALTALLDLHHFRRASDADALYGVDGSVSRAAGTASARTVGTELDLTGRFLTWGRRLQWQGGASIYWPGEFVRQTGSASTITWIYLQATLAL